MIYVYFIKNIKNRFYMTCDSTSAGTPRWSCIFQALDRTALHSHRRLEMSDIFHLFFFSKNDNQANCTKYSKRVEKR